MKTVLIAEDEKFIRLGLKTMLQRSDIPVEEIYEARDGEEALQILHAHPVDLLITDIQMPKMDGIALAERSRELPSPPMVLAVSGYDDFNYAVSMLRNGVSDYLLKPVERQKFCDVLEKLEAQYLQRQQAAEQTHNRYLRALRYLMLERSADSHEARELIGRYEGQFFEGTYQGFLCQEIREPLPQDVIALRAEGSCTLYLTGQADAFTPLVPEITGFSQPVQGLSALRQCYIQARAGWKQAFFAGKPCSGVPGKAAASEPTVTAEQLLSLVGLSRDKEVLRLLDVQARMVRQGDLTPDAFGALVEKFIRDLGGTYKNLIDPGDDPVRFGEIWRFGSVQAYLDELSQWLSGFCGRIGQEFADYENKQKIRQAVCYIQENYRNPLNMTMVSNQVSMNYSLFSLLFKQYTGTNFVNYLQNLRLTEAKRLLTQTDWRIGEICRRSGFTDEKHFLKVFKNSVGLSPSEYRKTNMLREAIQGEEEKP